MAERAEQFAGEEQRSPAPEAMTFPDGFLWGVATASHQYEGGNTRNQWYQWEHRGRIANGERSGLACDWWEHAERDFDLAQSMGVNALRLSVEWSRVETEPGEWDTQALQRYRTMLIGLRERGIEPMVTLHHFTNPVWFERRGGFLARDAVARFTRYVEMVVRAVGDLCDFWCTLNEPNVYALLGYQLGSFPPGRRGDTIGAIRVQAQMARAHAAAYRAIHRIQPQARVGWAQHYIVLDPAKPRAPLDRMVSGLLDAGFNDFFARAVRSGDAAFPFALVAGDLHAVRDTCDFVGINCYYRQLVAFDLRQPWELFARRFAAPGVPQGDPSSEEFSSQVYPSGIVRLAERAAGLGKPIYITENGVADASDRLRPWLLQTAVRAMYSALGRGVDLRGYFHWSLVDNFEWADGWQLRFGLVALDETTQQRTMRRSGAFYQTIARANGLTPAMLQEFTPAQSEGVRAL